MSKLPWHLPPPRPKPDFSPDDVLDISEAVYRLRLGGVAEVAAMIKDDKDDGQKLRRRARCYDVMTRAYLDVLKQRGMLKEHDADPR